MSSCTATLAETSTTAPLEGLRYLDLTLACLSDFGVQAMISLLRLYPRLVELKLCNTSLGDKEAVALAELLRFWECSRGFSERDSARSKSADERTESISSSQTLATGVVERRNFLPTLELLTVYNNEIGGVGGIALLGAARQHPTLRHLDLTCNRCFEKGGEIERFSAHLTAVLASTTTAPAAQLTFLSLGGNGLGHEQGSADENLAAMKSFVNIFRFLSPHRLETLNLSRCRFPEACVPMLKDVFSATPTLKSLVLYSCELTSVGALLAVNALLDTPAHRHLTFLDMSSNKIGDVNEAAPFLESLPKLSRLEFLNLCWNPFTNRACRTLAEAALKLRRLKDWKQCFWFATPEALVDFVAQLADHPSLEVLYIEVGHNSYYQFTTSGAVLPKVPFLITFNDKF